MLASLLNLYLHLPLCKSKLLTPPSFDQPTSAAYVQRSGSTPLHPRHSHLLSSYRQIRSQQRWVNCGHPCCSPGSTAVRPKRLIYEASQPASPPLRLPVDLRAPLVCISPSDLHPPSNTHQTTSRRAKENKTNASNSRGSCHNHHSSLASNSITATTPHPRISPCTF